MDKTLCERIVQWMLSTWEEIKLVYTSHYSQKLISGGLKDGIDSRWIINVYLKDLRNRRRFGRTFYNLAIGRNFLGKNKI